MRTTTRFACPSVSLALSALLRRTTGVLWVCLGLGVAIHLSFTAIRGLEAEQKVSKPLTTQFVKRAPRLTKPLELKKRPQPKRRTVQREMVAVKARRQLGQSAVGFEPVHVLGGLARPASRFGRVAQFGISEMEPRNLAAAVEGTRQEAQRIDMSLELMDVEALDTGRHHAIVIQDAADKRSVKGFCRLAVVYSPLIYPPVYPSFDGYIMPAYLQLAAAMNTYTDVKTSVTGRITLNSADLMRTPWAYFMAFYPFVLADTEVEYLGRYLMSGGFVFADGHPGPQYVGGRSLRKAVLDALRSQRVEATPERLPESHGVYHCYFDIEGPPLAADYIHTMTADVEIINYLDGVTVDGRLVAIVTEKGFYSPWKNWGTWKYDSTPAARFGVNTIIFALTQEGSITHQLLDSLRY